MVLGLVQQMVWLTGRSCWGSWQASKLPLLMTLLLGDTSSSCTGARCVSAEQRLSQNLAWDVQPCKS